MWLCWLLKLFSGFIMTGRLLVFYLAYELTLPKWGKLYLILLSCFISTALSLVRDGANLYKALHWINIWTTKGGGCGGCSCKYKKYMYPLVRPLWQPRSSICGLCECLVPTLSLVNPAWSTPPSHGLLNIPLTSTLCFHQKGFASVCPTVRNALGLSIII